MAGEALQGAAMANPYMAAAQAAIGIATAPPPSQTASAQSGQISFGAQNFGTSSDGIKYAAIGALVLVAFIFLRKK